MDRRTAATLVAAFALSAGAASAASPDAAAAARDATLKAKAVTFALMQRGGAATNLGTVTLQRIGGTRTRIRIQLANPAAAGTRITLHRGTCHDPHFSSAATSMLLNPFTGRVSQTIVAVPLTNLQSGKYLVAVQNQTARQQFVDACAQLR